MLTMRMKKRLVLFSFAFAFSASKSHSATLYDLTYVQFTGNIPFERQVEATRALDIKRVRLGLRWGDVQAPNGQYRWNAADFQVGKLLRAGFSPIVTLFGRDPTLPREKGDGRKIAPTTEPSLTGFAKFAAGTVGRLGHGSPERPIIYEIWNEPNSGAFWWPVPDPEGYARMAEAACRAMKGADKKAVVIGLAMEGTPVKAPFVWKGIDLYRDWSRRAATPGLMNCLDGFSMHPYRRVPETYLQDEAALATFVKGVWSKPQKPLIVNGEWGYESVAKNGEAMNERQAAETLRMLLIGTGLGRPTNIYQVVDGDRDPKRNGASFGLFTYAGEIKPSGQALKRLLTAIGNWEIEGIAPASGTADVYRFTASNKGRKAMVLWSRSVGASFELPKGASVRSGVDLVTGAVREVKDGRLAIDQNPVIVTW